MTTAKPFDIPKREVWEAFKKVKANQGAAGVDGTIDCGVRGRPRPVISISSGTGCPREVTFHRRYAGWTSRRQMAGCVRWAFQRWPIVSPKRLSAGIWSRAWNPCSTPTSPTATGPAARRSMPCARRASGALAMRLGARASTLAKRSLTASIMRCSCVRGPATYRLSVWVLLYVERWLKSANAEEMTA